MGHHLEHFRSRSYQFRIQDGVSVDRGPTPEGGELGAEHAAPVSAALLADSAGQAEGPERAAHCLARPCLQSWQPIHQAGFRTSQMCFVARDPEAGPDPTKFVLKRGVLVLE